MYKWVDEAGNVTYQDQPPPGQEESTAVFAEDAEVSAEIAAGKAQRAEKSSVPVILYSVPVCDACDLVRNLLERNGVPFTEKDAGNDISVQKELMDLAGQLSVPLLSVGEDVVDGYSSTAIESRLAAAGYTVGGDSVPGEGGQHEDSTLSEGQIAEQAAQAAAALTADLDKLTDDSGVFDDPDTIEEIPEDERIKVPPAE